MSLIVFLLLFDVVHPNERKDSNGIVTKLNDGFMEKSIVKHWYKTDNVTSGVNDDGEGAKITDNLDNWSDTNTPSSSDNDNQEFIKPNKKRGRQHRHINYIKTSPQNPKAEFKAREDPRDIKESSEDIVSIYNALVNELEDNEELKSRLDALEVEMDTMSDVTRHIDVNASASSKAAACSCPDAINREELEVVKVHLRRMYLMLNAQEDRHRDMLDLVKAYRLVK